MGTAQHPSQPAFAIDVVPDRSEVAVVPTGELDLTSAEDLGQEVQRLWDVGFDHVLVDLRRLSFMDSTGLHLLLRLRDAAGHDGKRLTLVPGPSHVQRVFELTSTRSRFAWRDH